MIKQDIEHILQLAKQSFLLNDKTLLTNGVNERSLTHKFAEYLQLIVITEFPDKKIHVDCEYNRDGGDPKYIYEIKKIVGPTDRTDSTSPKTVYPDIIIHKRGKDGPNYVVIEAKKNPNHNDKKDDISKLKKIREFYQYSFAVFLNFDLENKNITWEFIVDEVVD